VYNYNDSLDATRCNNLMQITIDHSQSHFGQIIITGGGVYQVGKQAPFINFMEKALFLLITQTMRDDGAVLNFFFRRLAHAHQYVIIFHMRLPCTLVFYLEFSLRCHGGKKSFHFEGKDF
ncbi:hypothetical protein ACJX0J_024575, partial [Zea mays]